tara:strand:- start:1267 stop:1647 length:381 start_codon:yes stop_codon:yes gene_type:complete
MENSIDKSIKFIERYSINLASFLLDYDSDKHHFDLNIQDRDGVVEVSAIENEQDGGTITKFFNVCEDVKNEIGYDSFYECLEYLYKEGELHEQVPEGMCKKDFMGLFVANLASNYANETRNMNYEI